MIARTFDMHWVVRPLLLLGMGLGLCLPVMAAEKYDLVILNGRVMDPASGLDEVRNVGVRDGQIAAITKDGITGRESIDAKGHVVAPGFIDGHSHSTNIPLGQKALLRDGVTTALELEGGALPVARWYAELEGKSQLNYGASVSSSAARTVVFDPEYATNTTSADIVFDMMSKQTKVSLDTYTRLATPAEVDQIVELVEEGLKQGGLGIGVTPGYIVDAYSSQEVVGMQQLAGEYGRFIHAHARFSSQEPPTTGLLAFQEFISGAGEYGGGLILAHFTAQALNLTGASIDYIDGLREEGVPVILEIYPYNFGDAGTGVSADYLKPDNYQSNMGRSYNDIINAATLEPLTKQSYEALLKKNPFAPVLFYNAKEEDVEKGVAHPDILIGCDCFYFTDQDGQFVSDWDAPFESLNTHPRTVGTHGKVLRMSREQKLMPLMTAISKMSYLYADFLANNGVPQMAKKGRIQIGADADIIVIDAENVRDNSKLAAGKTALPTTGIPYVVVNGTIVVKNSKTLKGVYAGKPVRLAVQD